MRYYDEAKTHKTEVYDTKWGYSSVGRAPALQAGGQEFESPYLHHCSSLLAIADDKGTADAP